MAILNRTSYNDKKILCGIKNHKRNQEYELILYKDGTYKIIIDGRELQKNKIAYNRSLKKIFEL